MRTSAFRSAGVGFALLLLSNGIVGCAGPSSASPGMAGALLAPSAIRAPQAPVDLSRIRQATARFQNIDVALGAGYVDDGYGCIDATTFGLDPSLGAMGFHLINETLHADPTTDPTAPDLLVYEPAHGGGTPKLVALEYEVFKDDWFGYAGAGAGAAPPTLLGHDFLSIDLDDLHVFALHLWLWRDNPNGAFEDFNPRVSCR
ncbi:MAG TPA: hypothetical protein VM032_08625 [Vicinamibacterales bacterium]|nr:hypothetical protein [Vicinamibacterales bacterium]